MNQRHKHHRRQPTAEAIQNVLATGNGLGLDALFGGGVDAKSMTSNADYSEGSSSTQDQQGREYQSPAILLELERDNNESIKMMSLIVLGN